MKTEKQGPGSIEYRFHALMRSLESRFPSGNEIYKATPPEDFYITELDELIQNYKELLKFFELRVKENRSPEMVLMVLPFTGES